MCEMKEGIKEDMQWNQGWGCHWIEHLLFVGKDLTNESVLLQGMQGLQCRSTQYGVVRDGGYRAS